MHTVDGRQRDIDEHPPERLGRGRSRPTRASPAVAGVRRVVPTSAPDLAPRRMQRVDVRRNRQPRAVATALPHAGVLVPSAAPRSTSTTSTRAVSAPSATSLGSGGQLRALGRHAVRPGDRDEVDRLRGREQRLELGQIVLRQVREDAAAVVVDDDEGGRRPGAGVSPRPSRPFVSCRKQRSPHSADDRARRARPATPSDRRHEAVDAVRAPVREHPQSRARRHAPLERAHRQARRDDERAAVGNRGRDVARDATLARDGRRRGPRRAPRRARRSASSQSASHGSATARGPPSGQRRSSAPVDASSNGPASARTRSCATCCGSSHASSGSTRTVGTVVEPRVRDLARERRADPHDEVGPVGACEPVDAQQRLVGRDRVRTRPQLRQRIGEDRPARSRRRTARRPPGSTPAPQPATSRPRGCARTSAARRDDIGAGGRGARSTCGSTARRRRDPARRPAARRSARAARGTAG